MMIDKPNGGSVRLGVALLGVVLFSTHYDVTAAPMLPACVPTGGICTPLTFAVGGTVSGLSGSGLVLHDSGGGDDQTVSSDGSFVFQNPVASGKTYTVTVKTQPTGPLQGCSVTNASGKVGFIDVTNVAVSCGPIALLAGALGGLGSIDGDGSAARFNGPSGVAADRAGNVYVTDTANSTIRKITPAGVVSTLAGAAGQFGSADGNGSTARFSYPYGVATDSAGNVYVADTSNSAIRKVTAAGVVTTVAGTPGARGVRLGPLPGSLNRPKGLAVLPDSGVTLIETGEENAVLQITLP
jgi:NHL repeat